MELSIFHTIILGIIEGITEFIPVSSTAHLLFTRELFSIPVTEVTDMFIVAVQSGAILAALWYFWKEFKREKAIFLKIAVAFIPTAIVGLLLSDVIHLVFKNKAIIGIALIVGGIIFLCLPKKSSREENIEKREVSTSQSPSKISWKQAIFLGIMQLFAFIPGVSRSGSLLIGGAFTNLSRKQIALFSFLLALPTIFGATVVDLYNNKALITPQFLNITALGAGIALIISLFTMNFFLKFLEKENALQYFGIYRIILGILALIFLV